MTRDLIKIVGYMLYLILVLVALGFVYMLLFIVAAHMVYGGLPSQLSWLRLTAVGTALTLFTLSAIAYESHKNYKKGKK